jgi:hypothetical protein
VTQRQVIEKTSSILLVIHNEDDDGWQFLTGEPFLMADAKLVSLGSIVKADPSLFTIANLPPGWQASRASPEGEWVRLESPPEEHEA